MAAEPAKVVSTSAEASQLAGPPHLPVGLRLISVPGQSFTPRSSVYSSGIDCLTSPLSDDMETLGSNTFRIKDTFAHMDVEVDADGTPSFGLPPKSVSQPDMSRDREAWRSQDLPSVGAAFHSSGQCKPCAWFWKADGCKWGAECGHCHLCPEGELRRRKKERQSEMKELRAAVIAS